MFLLNKQSWAFPDRVSHVSTGGRVSRTRSATWKKFIHAEFWFVPPPEIPHSYPRALEVVIARWGGWSFDRTTVLLPPSLESCHSCSRLASHVDNTIPPLEQLTTMMMMNTLRGLLWVAGLWALVSPSVNAEDGTTTTVTWGGCEDPVKGARKVTIGDKTTVCLTISDGTDWSEARQYIRLNFQPVADEYSRFVVPNSYKEMIVDTGTRVSDIFVDKDIAVHASSQKAISFQKKYYDSAKKQVFPFLTAVIDVKDGVVMGVAWDDASIFCGLTKVDRNTLDFEGQTGDEKKFEQVVEGCYFTAEECTTKSEGCDLLLHVVWTGTDAKGRSFLSSSYRYSAFPPQEWGDRLVGILPDVKG